VRLARADALPDDAGGGASRFGKLEAQLCGGAAATSKSEAAAFLGLTAQGPTSAAEALQHAPRLLGDATWVAHCLRGLEPTDAARSFGWACLEAHRQLHPERTPPSAKSPRAPRVSRRDVKRLERRADALASEVGVRLQTVQRLDGELRRLERCVGQGHGADTQGAEACPVCFCHPEAAERGLLPCGHGGCVECLLHATAVQPRCPCCREHCTVNDVMPLDRGVRSSKYGSRVEILLELLARLRKEEPGCQVLVFVQWQPVWRLAAGALSKAGVPYVACSGNAKARKRAVRRFRRGAGPGGALVLMLSPVESVMDLDLRAARHVVLLHPLVPLGSAAARAAEGNRIMGMQRLEQRAVGCALGRAAALASEAPAVKVWRFVASCTEEERLADLCARVPLSSPAHAGDGD